MSLKEKTIKGLTWSGISQSGRQLSQFIVTIILARLLAPNDFGLLGMALVFTQFANIFNEMGVGQALIQKQDIRNSHYSSVFWLNIIVGISLMLLMIVLSPLISVFYNQPILQPMLRLISITFFISSFGYEPGRITSPYTKNFLLLDSLKVTVKTGYFINPSDNSCCILV